MNKPIKIVLFVAVGLLWGTIGVKLYNMFFSKPSVNNEVSLQNRQDNMADSKDDDDFILTLNYADPFLKNTYKPKPIAKKKKDTLKPNVVIKPKVSWPHIDFYGTIAIKSGNKTAIVKISNKKHLVHTNETVKDIEFKQIYNDSILVIYKNQEKLIYKKD